MINKSFCLILIIINNFHNGESVNYNPYTNQIMPQTSSAAAETLPQNEHHLLHRMSPGEAYNNNNAAAASFYSTYQQNHAVSSEPNSQANRNYQQLYRYYNEATPLRQPPQPQPTRLWSGPPIVVGDDTYLTSNIPQPIYNTFSSTSRNSKALPAFSNQQQPNYDNNNNNIVYHKDFRHEIVALPQSKDMQQNRLVYTQQQQQYVEKPQQFYASNRNLPYDYASESSQNNFNLNNRQYDSNRNDVYYTTLRRNNFIDYTDYFQRYLKNNPRRIKPLY